jgi:uncharacterized phiE125 gp8 family phage protein
MRSHELGLTDSLVSTVAAGSPPVQALTLDYAKQHIRALGSVDDFLTAVYIDAAASYFEEQTGRQLLTATREVWLDAFPALGASGMEARIELPRPPLQKVLDVRYVSSSSGALTSVTGGSPAVPLYTWVAPAGEYARRGVVEPLYGQSWPQAQRRTAAVRISYACGYGADMHAIPPLVRGVLCYLVAHFDTFRTAVHEARRGAVLELPYGVKMLLDGFKYTAYPSQLLREMHWPEGLSDSLAGGARW